MLYKERMIGEVQSDKEFMNLEIGKRYHQLRLDAALGWRQTLNLDSFGMHSEHGYTAFDV